MEESQLALEDEALRLAFSGTDRILAMLNDQILHIDDRERDWSGIGFFTKLKLTDAAKAAPFEGEFGVFGLTGSCPTMPDGFTLTVWAVDGFIDTIEGLSNGERWESPENFNLELDGQIRSAMAPCLNLLP